MARVAVPRTVFDSGLFPPVCAKTGRRAERQYEVSLPDGPNLSGPWLLLLGLLPYLTVTSRQRRHKGLVPLSRRAVRRLDVATKVRNVAAAVTVVSGLLTVFSTAFVRVTLTALVVAVTGMLVVKAWTVSGGVYEDGRLVQFTGIHPLFAEYVAEAGLARAVADRRARG